MAKLFIEDIDVKGKKVLMRVDFNVPLDADQSITDDTRIRAALPSIKYIIENGGKAVLMSHLGRPKGEIKPGMSLKPVADRLGEILGTTVKCAPDCVGPEVEQMANELGEGEVLMLENLRFHKEEEKNDSGFAAKLAKLGDVYINDAFGTAHRAHASTGGVTAHFDKCAAGYLLIKEIKFLGGALAEPKRPFVAILGGAKVSSKLGVIESLLEKVDTLLIGGGMAYTFLKAQGHNVGDSLLEEDLVETAREMIAFAKEKGVQLLVPEDYVVADKFDSEANFKVVASDGIEDGWMGMDMGPESTAKFKEVIKSAATVLWNGPVGVFEMPSFAKGTNAIAATVAETDCISIVGGGDSISAINKSGVADKISHISTGGGASLEYIENGTLPGIETLTDK
jgi:phosphoglycerate kinase